jgi:hypothetical protein
MAYQMNRNCAEDIGRQIVEKLNDLVNKTFVTIETKEKDGL